MFSSDYPRWPAAKSGSFSPPTGGPAKLAQRKPAVQHRLPQPGLFGLCIPDDAYGAISEQIAVADIHSSITTAAERAGICIVPVVGWASGSSGVAMTILEACNNFTWAAIALLNS